MNKKYFARIIAKDNQGLQLISAYCCGSKVTIKNIKYLPRNKILVMSIERIREEKVKNLSTINSICKFEFIDGVKSKNINQHNKDLELELITIDLLKKDKNYEINLIFSNNSYITLSTEIIEATLEDQK